MKTLTRCWKHVDRDIKNKARDQITGRVNQRVTAATNAPAKAEVSGDTASGQPNAAPTSVAGESNDAKFAKRKGYCAHFYTKGTCSRGVDVRSST